MTKVCSKCKLEKDVIEFYKNKRFKDGLDYYCKDCRKVQVYDNLKTNGYQNKNIELVQSLKSPCEKCGEDRLYLIQFHHVDPKNKLFPLSIPGCRCESAIYKEVGKCVCLCANCHAEFHYFYGKRPSNPVESFLEYIKE